MDWKNTLYKDQVIVMKNHMNKRDKFKDIMNSMDYFQYSNAFYFMKGERAKESYGKSIIGALEGKQKEVYEKLVDLKYNNRGHDYKDKVSNTPVYQEAIEQALQLIREMLMEFVGEPICFPNGYKYETIDEYMAKFDNTLSSPEWSIAEFSSRFACVQYAHTITKIGREYKDDGNGYPTNYLTSGCYSCYPRHVFPDWLSEMGEGNYIIDGEKFEISSSEIRWEYGEDGDHILANYIDQKELKEFYEDIEEVNCHRCGDGGCPSCDTTGFFTGIRL